MTKKEWPYDQQFSDWWDVGVDGEDNPYNKDTPAFWAWEGWLAGRAAEREACKQIAHDTYEGFGVNAKGIQYVKQRIIKQIEERGKE